MGASAGMVHRPIEVAAGTGIVVTGDGYPYTVSVDLGTDDANRWAYVLDADLAVLGQHVRTGRVGLSTPESTPNSLVDLPTLIGSIGAGESAAAAGDTTATATGVDLTLGGVIGVTADAVTASADPPGSTLAGVGVTVLGVPVSLPADPEPNTEIALRAAGIQIAALMLNEQTVAADGAVTVTGLRLTLIGGVLGSIGTGMLRVASAHVATADQA